MAEQIFNSVTLAVTGELTSRVFSGLIQRYGKDAATSEKLQRLEMLLIKIHSAVEASEKRNIKNLWLLQWHDKLKEAASQGDEVLARFLQPAKDVEATSNAGANQKQGEADSSSAAAPDTDAGVMSFTRNSLSGIVQGICSGRKMLLVSCDNDLERLNKILTRLEKLSPDLGEFIRLLHLEALQKVVRLLHGPMKKIRRQNSKKIMRRLTTSDPLSRPSLFSFSPPMKENTEGVTRLFCLSSPKEEKAKRVARLFCLSRPKEEKAKGVAREFCLSRPKEEKAERVAREFCLSRPKEEKTKRVTHEFCLPLIDELDELALVTDAECDSSVPRKERQSTLLQDRLLAAFTAICEAVELAGSRDLEDLEWLAYWTGILREAKHQGCAVLGAISAGKTINMEDNETMVEFDQEKDELGGFVHRLEGLASDVEHFKKLLPVSG